jgi:hypothetical protein
MSGRFVTDCELYAMPDLGRAPELYAAPVAELKASHAFDEAKERELFESDFNALELQGVLNSWTGRWEYDHPHINSLWQGWLRCAKSRAKRFGEQNE